MSHRAPCLLSRFACQGLMFDWLCWHTLNIATTTKRRGVDGTCTQLESVDESFNLKCLQWMSLQAAALAPHLSAQLICSFRAQMRPTQNVRHNGAPNSTVSSFVQQLSGCKCLLPSVCTCRRRTRYLRPKRVPRVAIAKIKIV